MDKNTFSKMIPSNSFSNIHQEYLAAMKWMTDLGIDLQVGRTSNYEKVIGYWKDAYLTACIEEADQAFPDFVSSLLEIVEFTRIHQALQGVAPLQQIGRASCRERVCLHV